MPNSTVVSEICGFPQAFSIAVAEEARLDAEIVGKWLVANLGETVRTTPLPGELILGVALGLRLCRWEVSMIQVHLDNGLPSGPQILAKTIQEWAGPELQEFVLSVGTRITQVCHEKFLWAAETPNLGFLCAVQSDEEDDLLIECVADFLARRR